MKKLQVDVIKLDSLKLSNELYFDLYNLASYKGDTGFSFFITKSNMETSLHDIKEDSKNIHKY